MDFPSEFFHLNLIFAQKAAALTGLTWDDALRFHTHLYLSFNIGREFDAKHPVWRAYLDGLHAATNPLEWTVNFYRRRLEEDPKQEPALSFGCFSYAIWQGGRVRIHFRHNDPGFSPLSRERAMVRRAELGAMFDYLRAHEKDLTTVIGGSWLYHLEAYRRLFPPGFLASARSGPEPETRFISLWGQFLDHHGQVKPEMARRFTQDIGQAQTLDGLLACFPYSMLRLEGPLAEFYSFLGI